MDEQLRQLQRFALEDPQRYYHHLKRAGILERLKKEDPVEHLYQLQKCNRLGPTNLAILGMLGYRPAVVILGGDAVAYAGKRFYWYKGSWYTERQLNQTAYDRGQWWRRGPPYRKHLHRLAWFIYQVPWVEIIAKPLRDHRQESLEEWLVNLENRTILLQHLLEEL